MNLHHHLAGEPSSSEVSEALEPALLADELGLCHSPCCVPALGSATGLHDQMGRRHDWVQRDQTSEVILQTCMAIDGAVAKPHLPPDALGAMER